MGLDDAFIYHQIVGMKDFYEILGVSKDANPDSIKKAYRKLAMQFHPDKNPGNKEAEDKFKEAASAYEILSNPEKRRQYDTYGHAAFQSGGRGGFGGGGFSDVNDIFESFGDIFSDFFGGQAQGGRNQRSSVRKGSDLRYLMEVDLKEVLSGIEKEISFETEDNCEPCNGSGADPKHGVETCGTCGGRGQVVRSQGFFQLATTCPTCRGAGKKIKKPCEKCAGQGRVSSRRKLKVKVPAGVDTGTRLRISNEGEGGYSGGPRGDLYVEVRVEDHPKFERQAQNLYSDVKISYTQAILGCELDVDTLEGKEKIKIPHGTQSGAEVELTKHGLPSLRSPNSRGHIYYRIQVEIPKKLKPEEEEKLREIATLRGETVGSKKKGFFN